QLGNVALRCITLTWNKGAPVAPIQHSYCVSPDHMILRMALSEYGTFQAVYNNMVKLGDQYIAQDVKVVTNGVPVMNFHVQQIENMASVNDADFTPPPKEKKQGEPTALAF